MLLLLICWIIAGITAEDTPAWHYGVKNGSLCLQVGKSPPYHNSWWSFEKTRVIVMNKNITKNYRGKVDYYSSNYSLCINKLTETDSGIYTFSFFDPDILITETHRLIVQEAVPTPVIRMSGQHSNLSAGLCNITVNCSIQDDWVWSVCDVDSCTTARRSLRKVNITILTDNRSIVCRGNNHVSTSNVSESIEATCSRKSNSEPKETSDPTTVKIIIIAVCVCLFVFVVCVAKGLCSTDHSAHQGDTPTAQLIENQPVDAQLQPVQRVSTSSSSQAEASYENVDTTQPCQTSSPSISPRGGLGSEQSQKVDTIYSILQAPNVTSSLGKGDSSKDTKGPKEVQEASMSQYAILDEAQHPAKIDTVYSVLQKPKNLQSQHHQ